MNLFRGLEGKKLTPQPTTNTKLKNRGNISLDNLKVTVQHQSLFLHVMPANSVLSLASILSREHPGLFKQKLLSQICRFFLVEQTSIFRSQRNCPLKEASGPEDSGNTNEFLTKMAWSMSPLLAST